MRSKAAGFGYEMLDELTIPFDRKDPDLEQSQVTVGLLVNGPVSWQPTRSTDKRWDPSNREMCQVNDNSGGRERERELRGGPHIGVELWLKF